MKLYLREIYFEEDNTVESYLVLYLDDLCIVIQDENYSQDGKNLTADFEFRYIHEDNIDERYTYIGEL